MIEGSKCQMHGFERTHYCVDCTKALCPECILEEHEGHQRKKVAEVYKEKKEQFDLVV